MKAKELLNLQLEVLPPYKKMVNGNTVDSNSFPIGVPQLDNIGFPCHLIPIKFTGTKDEAEILAMMPQMLRAIHGMVRGRKKAAQFAAAFPKEAQEFHRIINAVMERCEPEITGKEKPSDFEDKKPLDKSPRSD